MGSFSKALSRLLRYDALKAGLCFSHKEYFNCIDVYNVVYIKRYNPTLNDFMEVGNLRREKDNKKRYDMRKING